MEHPQYIAQLILRQLKDELNETEATELEKWIKESAANRELYEHLINPDILQEKVTSF